MREFELEVGGRVVHCYDRESGDLPVIWHHGTPNVGEPPQPLFDAADRLGLRWVSFDRPGYGGSTPDPGRSVGSVGRLVAALADALSLDRFAMMGHSGGSSHALAAGAALPERTAAVVSVAALAPIDAAGLDWYAGMGEPGAAGLRAAEAGRPAKVAFELGLPEDAMPAFTEADLGMFGGPWRWLPAVAGRGLANGPDPLIDDDLAYVQPWQVELSRLTAPVLLCHGGQDLIAPPAHSQWLAGALPAAELRLQPEDGHISVLRTAESALEWVRGQVSG